MTDICQRTDYFLCVPYAIHSGFNTAGLYVKIGVLCVWVLITIAFAGLRRLCGDPRYIGHVVVDSMGRSLSVSVSEASVVTAKNRVGWRAETVILGTMDLFAVMLATFVSGALFEEYLTSVGGDRTIRNLDDLIAAKEINVSTFSTFSEHPEYVDR